MEISTIPRGKLKILSLLNHSSPRFSSNTFCGKVQSRLGSDSLISKFSAKNRFLSGNFRFSTFAVVQLSIVDSSKSVIEYLASVHFSVWSSTRLSIGDPFWGHEFYIRILTIFRSSSIFRKGKKIPFFRASSGPGDLFKKVS